MNYLLFGLVGYVSGILSGIFGIGGGTITVPLMMLLGMDLKNSIGISAMQMSVSSIYGTFLNKKTFGFEYRFFFKIAIAGLLGGLAGANLVSFLNEKIITYVFILFILFSIFKTIFKKPQEQRKIRNSPKLLFFLVFLISYFASLVGVGGGILLIPLLTIYFGYSTKEATIISLFFIAFTASMSFFVLSFLGYVHFSYASLVACCGILGVRNGVFLKQKLSNKQHKNFLVVFYFLLLAIFVYKVEFSGNY